MFGSLWKKPFTDTKAVTVIVRLWALVILMCIVYFAYQLGFTDKYKPTTTSVWSSGSARIAYVNKGLYSLRHLSITNIALATSFVITPVIFFVLLFYPKIVVENSTGKFLAYANLFLLTVFNVLSIDITNNYYCSRYFLPVLFPFLFFLFCNILFNIRSKVVFSAVMLALVSGVLFFNIRHDYYLYKNQVWQNRYEAIHQISDYMPKHSYVFLLVDDFSSYFLQPNLRFLSDLKVINLQSLDGKKTDWNTLTMHINEYASELDMRDYYVISVHPYADHECKIVYFESSRHPWTIDYPTTFNETVYKYYIYHSAMNGNDYFNQTNALPLKNPGNIVISGFAYKDWSTGDIIINNLEYKIKPGSKYLVIKSMGWYQNFVKQFHVSEPQITAYANGYNLQLIRMNDTAYYYRLNNKIKVLQTLNIKSSTFIPKNFGINDDVRSLGIDISNITIE